MSKLLRITTVPISLDLLLKDQMAFMKRKGFEVLMGSADGPERETVTTREGCEHVVIPFTRQITPLKDLMCLIKLIGLIKREKPDIVHTHTPKAGLLGMLAAKICGVKVRLHTVAGLPLMTATGFKRRVLVAMEKLTVWASHKVLPNSHSLKVYMLDNRLANKNKLEVIGKGSTNGIDLSRFSESKLNPDTIILIKRTIAYHKSNTYMLSIGRLVKDKGIIELVKAFHSLKQEIVKLKLILLGPLERVRAEEHLPFDVLDAIEKDPDIIHIDWSDKVEYYLHIADLFVQSSHREGFPNVTLQAGAMKCPIVCSNIPGNIDIVSDYRTGYLFKKADQQDLESKIKHALIHNKETEAMSHTLRQEIELYYDRMEMHEAIYKLYQQQLAQ